MELILSFIPVFYYCMYLLYHTYQFITYRPQYVQNPLSVSIIIPVRNEQKYLKDCIESIIKQNYPQNLMEVIVVNDHSEDDTLAILKCFQKYDFIKVLNLPYDKKGKKESIQYGIENSNGEIIITTDGDTLRGNEWIQTMVNYFDEETAMVSGPVRLTGNSIFQQMQALEFSGLILLGGAMIAAERPSLCNGANLAYRKKVFLEVNGFQNIDQIASGDDELLLHKIRNLKKYKIQFAKNQKAIVETPAQTNLKTFLHQRLRWTSKSTVYPDKLITFHLVMAYFANLSIFSLFISVLFNPSYIQSLLFLILLKIFSETIVLLYATSFLKQRSILKWILVEQFLHIPYVLWVGLYSQLKKNYEWKGRNVK